MLKHPQNLGRMDDRFHQVTIPIGSGRGRIRRLAAWHGVLYSTTRARRTAPLASRPEPPDPRRLTEIADLWRDDEARSLSEPELLRYRSNLLGRDLRITNFGGGNTSAKLRVPDPLTGEPVEVLWVKGSGGDLGSSTLDSFATLYLDKLEHLTKQYRGREHEDQMPARFAHCTFDLNPAAPSIDTPPPAILPHRPIGPLPC